MFKNTVATEVEVLESITYEDIDQIGKNQTDEYLPGWFPVWVEVLEENKEARNIIKGMNITKYSKVIATKHEYNFKRGDKIRFYGHEVYKVESIKEVIDPDFTNIVRVFPNARRLHTWKIIVLGG